MTARTSLRCAAMLTIVLAACEGPETFTDSEWSALRALSALPDPPADHSNKYQGDPAVIALGKKFYFDPWFAGEATHLDMLYRRTGVGRAPVGAELELSCNSCHQVDRGGSDLSSVPRHVAVGAGPYDVNSQPTLNSAYYSLLYWNGRADSLWAQAVAVGEAEVSMASDRLKIVWRIADVYRDEYTAAFPEWPLPALMDSVAAQKARLLADGSCALDNGACPPATCTPLTVGTTTTCAPRFPLRGRPGYDGQVGLVDDGTFRGCQKGLPRGNPLAPPEPFDDAFDCMPIANQLAVTRIYVNWAKALAAYEATLLSRDAAFDRWVAAGPESELISAAARRGAKLFVGKAACNDCHNTPLLSDQQFHNIGVPQVGDHVPTPADCPAGGWCDCVSDDVNQPFNCLPDGARDGLRKLQSGRYRRDSIYSDDAACQRNQLFHAEPGYVAADARECDGRVPHYAEVVRARAEHRVDALAGRWRTPSLRDVALTPPYMHNGRYQTLEQVLWHYNSGGTAGDGTRIGAADPRISPLALSEADLADLIAFLETLTGAPLPPEMSSPPAIPPRSPF